MKPEPRKQNLKNSASLAERRLEARRTKRLAKHRRRMPVHGAGLKKIGNIWQKRLRGQ